MANPVMPVRDQASAEALGGTTDARTGTTFIPKLTSDASSPTLFSRLVNDREQLNKLLAGAIQGACVSLESGLNVGVFEMRYRIGATEYHFPGSASFACTASATNHLYLDADQVLETSTSGWPGGDHVKLAIVVTSGSAVTSVIDARWMNFQLGVVNAWHTVAAAGNPDINDKVLTKVGGLAFSAAEALTIASGAISPTRAHCTVDTESAAAADDLTVIGLTASSRRILLLRAANAARVVTVKSTGNVHLRFGDAVLDHADKIIALFQVDDTTWVEWFRNWQSLSALAQNLDAAGFDLTNVGDLQLKPVSHNIVGGTTTKTASYIGLRSEVGGAADDFLTITGGADGEIATLYAPQAGAGEVITVKQGGNIVLAGGDFVMNSATKFIELKRQNGLWYETARRPLEASVIAALGHKMPVSIVCHYPGALSDGQDTWRYRCPYDLTIAGAGGVVEGAPSGASCIVHVLKNGATIFANDSEAVNIPAAGTSDASNPVEVACVTGDILTVIVTQASSATSFTGVIEAYTAAKAA